MNFDVNSMRLVRAMVIGCLVVIVMWAAAEVLKPVALAVLLSFLLAPLAARLEYFGTPRVLSVALVLLMLLGVVGATSYVVGGQFVSLAKDLPTYQKNIRDKVAMLKPSNDSAIDKVIAAVEDLGTSMKSSEENTAVAVRVVSSEGLVEQIHTVLGPFESALALGGIVLLLVVFLLLEREDISNRIIQLVGWGQIGVTTKTLSQIGANLSRYLAALALVNTGFGLSITLGLWAIGLPSPALWGFLAGIFRFIPYVGTVLSFSFPALIAIAQPHGWLQPFLVLALFAALELLVNSIEPYLYGKSTGISPIGLLISALFWTWLWGGLGLLLANALTVCLAVAGRSIPGLGFLDTLLRHNVSVTDDLRWYQRVLNRDQDGALSILDEALKTISFEEVCDQIIIPTLSRAEHDRAQRFIDERDVAFIWRLVREWLDDLTDRDDFTLTSPAMATTSPVIPEIEPLLSLAPIDAETRPIVGIATGGGADSLVLRMLNMLLKPSEVRLTIMSAGGSSLHISDKIGDLEPAIILISYLPPVGLTRARYLTKRIRSRYSEVPVVFGYWEAKAETPQVIERLRPASASRVVISLASARSLILNRAASNALTESTPS